MKKITSLLCLPFLIFSFFCNELKASDFCGIDCCPCEESTFDVSLRVAAFVPFDKKVKKIYEKAWGDYQIELNKTFYENWGAWINGQCTISRGRSYGYVKASTRMRLIPLSFGVKYNYEIAPCTNLYAGVGAVYSWLYIRDCYEYVHEHTKKGAWGGLFKLGLQYNCTNCISVEIFTDYLVQRFKFPSSQSSPYVERNDVKMDALIAGVGLGWRF